MSLETAWAELNRTLGKSWSWGAYEGKDQFEQALITALALMDKQMRRERQGQPAGIHGDGPGNRAVPGRCHHGRLGV